MATIASAERLRGAFQMSFREDYACPGSDGAIHRQRDPRQDTVKPERQRRRLYCGPKEARGSQQFLPSIGQYFPIQSQGPN